MSLTIFTDRPEAFTIRKGDTNRTNAVTVYIRDKDHRAVDLTGLTVATDVEMHIKNLITGAVETVLAAAAVGPLTDGVVAMAPFPAAVYNAISQYEIEMQVTFVGPLINTYPEGVGHPQIEVLADAA